jgi:hypothetical protein
MFSGLLLLQLLQLLQLLLLLLLLLLLWHRSGELFLCRPGWRILL